MKRRRSSYPVTFPSERIPRWLRVAQQDSGSLCCRVITGRQAISAKFISPSLLPICILTSASVCGRDSEIRSGSLLALPAAFGASLVINQGGGGGGGRSESC